MISSYQKKIVSFAQNYLKKNNNYVKITSYFATFEKNPGNLLLKYQLNKIFFFHLIWNYIIGIFSISNAEIEINQEKLTNHKKKEKVIISWAFKKNFKKNGSYSDKYLNLNSSDAKNTLFFLIYMDKKRPKKINENIILIYKKNYKFKYNLIFFLKYITALFYKYKISEKFLFKLNFFSAFSSQVKKKFIETINLKKIKKIFIVYEGQMFQKEIIELVRSKNKNIDIIGYDHSAPPPLPLNLIYDNFSPDVLLVTGKAQIKNYKKYLLWPKKKIKLINSLRFKNEKNLYYSNKIFIPFELNNVNKYLLKLKKLLILENINSKVTLTPQLHPMSKKFSNHLKFVSSIDSVIKNKVNKIKSKKKISIFFGQTTSVIVALELGIECYHICLDPIFDSYTSRIWNNIRVKQIDENIFKYTKIGNQSFLNLNSKKKYKIT
jgi:hypothetical protein